MHVACWSNARQHVCCRKAGRNNFFTIVLHVTHDAFFAHKTIAYNPCTCFASTFCEHFLNLKAGVSFSLQSMPVLNVIGRLQIHIRSTWHETTASIIKNALLLTGQSVQFPPWKHKKAKSFAGRNLDGRSPSIILIIYYMLQNRCPVPVSMVLNVALHQSTDLVTRCELCPQFWTLHCTRALVLNVALHQSTDFERCTAPDHWLNYMLWAVPPILNVALHQSTDFERCTAPEHWLNHTLWAVVLYALGCLYTLPSTQSSLSCLLSQNALICLSTQCS